MTPLAERLAVEALTKPKQRRWQITPFMEQLPHLMKRTLFFEISEDVGNILDEVMKKMKVEWNVNQRFDPRLAFLPGNSVWIELKKPYEAVELPGGEMFTGFFVNTSKHDPDIAVVDVLCGSRADGEFWKLSHEPLDGTIALMQRPTLQNSTVASYHFLIYAVLALINSPKVIPQETVEPHRGHMRSLRQHGLPFKPSPYRKITLSISRSAAHNATGEDAGGDLTGHRALHFVRNFVRFRRGKLELVHAHWRGDPNIGKKAPGTYRVIP